MRIPILAATAAAILSGCATAPQESQNFVNLREMQRLLAGKTPGQPKTCLPSYRTAADMVIIDDDTVLFRDGGRRVWRTEMRGRCRALAAGHYTLVTRNFGGQGPCSGDIAQLVDLSSGMTVGSCVWGDFVPYTRTGD